MDERATALAAQIGARVRSERQTRRWTLDQLAAAAGISRRAVISVEQGEANPSVSTLLSLSDALGIGLPALVEPPTVAPVKVTRAEEGAVLWTSDAGGRGVLVVGSGPPDVLELWEWTLAAGDRHASGAHTTGTQEVLQVREGILTLEVGDELVALRRGDSAAFPSDVPHAYRNEGKRKAVFTLAVFEPGVGA